MYIMSRSRNRTILSYRAFGIKESPCSVREIARAWNHQRHRGADGVGLVGPTNATKATLLVPWVGDVWLFK
jgi:hypothetical protein